MSKGTTETPHADGIVVSGKMKSSAFEFTRRKILFSGLLISAVVLVLALVWWQRSDKGDHAAKQQPAKAGAVSYQQRLSSEVAAAQQKVQTDSKNSKVNKSDLATDYIQLAIAYQNNHAYADAIKAYKQALNADSDTKRQALNGLMVAYAENGQSDQAIATGNERIAYLKSLKADPANEDPSIEQSISDTTAKIQKIKAGEPL